MLIESTGRLELPFSIAAHKAKLPLAICNAARVRNYAKSIGRFAKTDKLDAQDIARFGEANKPAVSALKPQALRDISDLLTLRSQHLEMSTMQKNRLKRMPGITQKSLNRKAVAALVGVAPMNRDSGGYKGKRYIRGGRHKVRTVLFVSMLSAIQCHPKLEPMYTRLLANGKPKKGAIVACMRKQLSILNQMVKTNTKWDENYA